MKFTYLLPKLLPTDFEHCNTVFPTLSSPRRGVRSIEKAY